MARQYQPCIDSQVPSHIAKFTTFTADIDLRAQSGYPNHCPQRLILQNTTAGALNASVVDIAGHTTVVAIPANQSVTLDGAIATVAAATDDTVPAIYAFWWTDSATIINP